MVYTSSVSLPDEANVYAAFSLDHSYLLQPLYRWRCKKRPAPWQTHAQPGSGPHMCEGLRRSWCLADALQQHRSLYQVMSISEPWINIHTSSEYLNGSVRTCPLCLCSALQRGYVNDKVCMRFADHCKKIQFLSNWIWKEMFLTATTSGWALNKSLTYLLIMWLKQPGLRIGEWITRHSVSTQHICCSSLVLSHFNFSRYSR